MLLLGKKRYRIPNLCWRKFGNWQNTTSLSGNYKWNLKYKPRVCPWYQKQTRQLNPSIPTHNEDDIVKEDSWCFGHTQQVSPLALQIVCFLPGCFVCGKNTIFRLEKIMHSSACKVSLFIWLIAAFHSRAQGSIYNISSSHFPPQQPFEVVWVEK